MKILFPILTFLFTTITPLYFLYNYFIKKNRVLAEDKFKLNLPIKIALFILIITFNLIVYGKTSDSPSVYGSVLFISILNICLFYLAKGEGGVFKNKSTLFIFFVSAISLLILPFRTNGFTQSILILLVLFNFTLLLITIKKSGNLPIKGIPLLMAIPNLVIGSFENGILFLKSLFGLNNLKEKIKNTGNSKLFDNLKTFFIGTTVFILIASLLSYADPVFSSFFKDILDQFMGRIFTSIFLSLLFIILITNKFKKVNIEELKLKIFSIRDLLVSQVIIVTLFIIFIFIQIRYLFFGNLELLKTLDLTYSEYARSGFKEIILAVILSLIVSYITYIKGEEVNSSSNILTSNTSNRILRYLNVFLLFEIFIILLSAAKRTFLYIEQYGFTRTRIIGWVFLAWVTGLLVLTGLLILVKKYRESIYLKSVYIFTAFVFLLLSFLNIDKMIVNARLPENKKIDVVYLSQLSSDGYKGWVDSTQQNLEDFNIVATKLRNIAPRNTFSLDVNKKDTPRSDFFKDKLSLEEKNTLSNIFISNNSILKKYDNLKNIYGPYDTEEFGNINEVTGTKYKSYAKKRYLDKKDFLNHTFSDYTAYKNLSEVKNLEASIDCIDTQIVNLVYFYNLADEINDINNKRRSDFSYPFTDTSFNTYMYTKNKNKIVQPTTCK